MIEFKFDTSDLQKFARDAERKLGNAANKMRLLMKGKQGRIGLKAIEKLGQIPGPPKYPIQWRSERQRRAFFATKGFGGGIPTSRKNTIIKSWRAEVITDPTGGVIVLSNPFDAWRFIQGPFVQPFHLSTGYIQVKDVQDEFLQSGTEIVTDAWFEAVDPFQ